MYLEYYVIFIIKIASCLGQQYAFRSYSALANLMCSAEKVQFSMTSVNDISCVRVCSLTHICHAVIFYHGNKTCFGLNTDDPFNVTISLPGAVFYKPTMSRRSTIPGCPTSTVSPVVFPPGVNSYGEEYPNDADETTNFTAPEGERVQLTFCGVEIECYDSNYQDCWSPDDGDSCQFDYLDILENGVSKTGRICGTSPVYVYQSTASSVTVMFQTDGSITFRGYQLEVAYAPAV